MLLRCTSNFKGLSKFWWIIHVPFPSVIPDNQKCITCFSYYETWYLCSATNNV